MIVTCEKCGKNYNDWDYWTTCPHNRIGFGPAVPEPDAKPVAAAVTTNPDLGFCIGSSVCPGISKLIEECGEVVQVCGKIMALGGMGHHWDGTVLERRLADEMADLWAAICFVAQTNGIDQVAMAARMQEKLVRFHTWHHTQGKT